jgi:hypothetical protein
MLGRDADEPGQAAARGEIDQRHPRLEDHENEGDAQARTPARRARGPDRRRDGEGVQA